MLLYFVRINKKINRVSLPPHVTGQESYSDQAVHPPFMICLDWKGSWDPAPQFDGGELDVAPRVLVSTTTGPLFKNKT